MWTRHEHNCGTCRSSWGTPLPVHFLPHQSYDDIFHMICIPGHVFFSIWLDTDVKMNVVPVKCTSQRHRTASHGLQTVWSYVPF